MAVTKRDLVIEVTNRLGLVQNNVLKIVQGTLDAITDSLSDGKRLELRGFGVFDVKTKKSRPARNPRTGEKVILPARRVVTFKPGKKMRYMVENGRSTPSARITTPQQTPSPSTSSGGYSSESVEAANSSEPEQF